MGRTTQPLKILLHPDIADWAVWQELREQGHTIDVAVDDYDLKLGPDCWYMTPHHKKYVKDAMKAARSKRYKPRKKKGTGNGEEEVSE